jgi:hypothetical protein
LFNLKWFLMTRRLAPWTFDSDPWISRLKGNFGVQKRISDCDNVQS